MHAEQEYKNVSVLPSPSGSWIWAEFPWTLPCALPLGTAGHSWLWGRSAVEQQPPPLFLKQYRGGEQGRAISEGISACLSLGVIYLYFCVVTIFALGEVLGLGTLSLAWVEDDAKLTWFLLSHVACVHLRWRGYCAGHVQERSLCLAFKGAVIFF